MAQRGARPKPTALKMVTGNPGKRDLPGASKVAVRKTPLEPPEALTDRQADLWRRYIDPAWWLVEGDAPMAFIWVCLQAEFQEDPGGMTAARISNLRSAASEIGFGPSSRARLALEGAGQEDPTDGFFN